MPVKIHGREYMTVAERVNAFRKSEEDGKYSILTELVSNEGDMVIMKASIADCEGRIVATGYAEEVRGSTNINKTSALENCETSAIGRALAAYGLSGSEYASANEVSDAIIKQEVMAQTDKLVRHNKAVTENLDTITFVKQSLATGDYSAAVEAMYELDEDTRMALNVAPTKGGIFTIAENKLFASPEYAAARTEYFGN